MEKPYRVFCCSTHEDDEFLQKLKKHLIPLQHEGWITVDADRDIPPGKDWQLEVDLQLETAYIILFLVSPDFMASDSHFNDEMPKALARHELSLAHTIPVIVRPTDWQGTSLGQLPALPKDLRPVSTWSDRDDAFLSVIDGIRAIIPDFPQNPKPVNPSLEKGSKALWNEDYNSAKRELRKAIEEIKGENRPEESAKARFFFALALLDGKLPRIHKLTVIEEIERLLSKASKYHNLYSYTCILAIIKYDFGNSNGFSRRKEEAKTLRHKVSTLTRVDNDDANIELLSRVQPDLFKEYGSLVRGLIHPVW